MISLSCALSRAGLALAIWAPSPLVAQGSYATPYKFVTLAGNAPHGAADGDGHSARFYLPSSVAVDNTGTLFVADTYNHTIRKITSDGVVATWAGTAGVNGSADGFAGAARFESPRGIAVDNLGNVFVADTGNNTIRKITSGGVVTTVAGVAGIGGLANGEGSAARFLAPAGLACDGAGNLYVADSANSAIRKVTPSGVVTTIAGGSYGWADGTGSSAQFANPSGLAVDAVGNLFVADTDNQTIRKVAAGGVVTTFAGVAPYVTHGLFSPTGVAVDSAGYLYVVDGEDMVKKITPGGVVSSLAGAGYSNGGAGSAADGTGSAAHFFRPTGIALDGAGNLYVADKANQIIRKVTPGGAVTTVAGVAGSIGSADGTGSAARFYYPQAVALDSASNAYVADLENNTIRKITPDGSVTTIAGAVGLGNPTDGVGSAARFYAPLGVAVDASANTFVADGGFGNNAIRKVTPTGIVTTVAGGTTSWGSADGTGDAAQFRFPTGVAVDGAGNLYVGDKENHTIRKLTPSGVVTTLAGSPGVTGSADGSGAAARFCFPSGVAVDQSGNIFVADTGNQTIRKLSSAGVVTTLAGLAGQVGSADGSGSAARFGDPKSVAVDAAGNVYVADTGNQLIRKISSTGTVTTLAGMAGARGSTDAIGSDARFSSPNGIAVDSSGNLYVADSENNSIRKGRLAISPSISAQPVNLTMAAGGLGILTLAAIGDDLKYQWRKNGVAIPTALSATTSSLVFDHTSFGDAGSYDCVISNAVGSVTTTAVTLTVTPPSRLVNIATRAYCATGNNVTIGGFVVAGTASKRVLIRAVGPSLTAAGIGAAEVLADPTIEVHHGNDPVITNDNWTDNPNAADFTAVGKTLGAGDLLATDTRSAGLLTTLAPGVYSFIVKGKNDTSGIVLLEVYDADSDTPTTNFVNISSRAYATTGNGVAIGGFVISGNAPKRVLLRAVGPSLAAMTAGAISASATLANPVIELHHGSDPVITNDNWGASLNATAITTTAARVGATPLDAADTASSALLVTLDPGVYSFIAQGQGGSSGIVLVEVYDAD